MLTAVLVFFFTLLVSKSKANFDNTEGLDPQTVSSEDKNQRLLFIPSPNEDIIKEARMEPTELIKFYGYPAENHSIITEDGYGLTMYRIPHGKISSNKTRVPLILVHGMNCQATEWFDNGEESFAFVAADDGYDVWMANLRGTTTSNHTKYNRGNREFWDFSLEEHAIKDIPPMVDYILNKTNNKKLIYMGHSMGTIVGFAFLSSKPEYNDKIAGIGAVSPVWVPKYLSSFLVSVLNHYKIFQVWNKLMRQYYIFDQTPLLQSIILKICPSSNPTFCDIGTNVGSGYDPLRNKTRMAIFTTHCSCGASLKFLTQMAQWYAEGEASRYDYGPKKNFKVYGFKTPPIFNISQVTVPVAIFHAANDPASTPIDVALLCRKLPNLAGAELLSSPMATHASFVWAAHGRKLIFDKVLKYFENFQK